MLSYLQLPMVLRWRGRFRPVASLRCGKGSNWRQVVSRNFGQQYENIFPFWRIKKVNIFGDLVATKLSFLALPISLNILPSSFSLSYLPLRQSGYLPSGRPRYSFTHLDQPPVLSLTSPSHARQPTRVGYGDVRKPKQNFNGEDIPFVSLNEEGRKRRDFEETPEESYVGGFANSGSFVDNVYQSNGKSRNEDPVDLGHVVDVHPGDLPTFFARSARGRNSTDEMPTRN